MKLLFVITTMSYGGATKMITHVARAMATCGHVVSIYAYAGNETQRYTLDNINYLQGKSFIGKPFLTHWLKYFAIKKIIKSEKPDIIVPFMPYPSMLCVLAGRNMSRVVVCERGDPAVYRGIISIIGHRIIQQADGAVFQTEGARSFYSGDFYNKSVVIPNAVTFNRLPRVSLDKRNNEIAFVGRFQIKQKRQDVMIKAMSLIVKTHPEIKLVFYGDGDDNNKIKSLVSQLSLEQYVIFAGKVNNIERCLQKSRMFVLTSDYEGIPNALIEAMCAGLPCVSTDCSPGGARLIIEDHVNGLIVPCNNEEAIADACLYILNNQETGEKMGEKAQDICDKYAPERIYPMWEKYLTSVYESIENVKC